MSNLSNANGLISNFFMLTLVTYCFSERFCLGLITLVSGLFYFRLT